MVKRKHRIFLIFFLLVAMILASHIGAVRAEEEFSNEYIYFDLRAGDVKFTSTTYSGSIYKADGTTIEKISGTHTSGKKYYIYQSEAPTTTLTPENPSAWYPIPSYTLMDDFFTDNSDVLDVEAKWNRAAAGRTMTMNAIYIAGGGSTYDITIDDIYTMRQNGGAGFDEGSFNFNATAANSKVYLRLKGDNRMGFLQYHTGSTTTSSLTFINGEPEENREGSLVVIGSQVNNDSNNSYYGAVPKNHWNSVIGGTDNQNDSRGLIFESGLIYAGATARENCTAIGGGGNGVGVVTIKGGKVTAVTESTGAAIGGGIAHQASGGPGIVTIVDGEVYAYNFGQQYAVTMNQSGLNDMHNTTGIAGPFVPGSAIGGGSSARVNGSYGTVKITGGYVYAESLGGSGIGGGNTVGFQDPASSNGIGGEATVEITGGTVVSISKSGYVKTQQEKTGEKVDTWVSPGAGIGGGSSIRKTGGKGTVTITGGIITTNGIGGGTSTNQTGGDAKVRVEGGTIKADTIGGGFSQTEGYAWGTVTITGGTLNSGMAAVPTNGTNQVYLTRATMYKDDVICEEVPISGFNIENVSNYGVNDVFTDKDGKLYLWIPADASIRSDVSDGVTYEALEEADGRINSKDQGVLKNVETGKEHCLVNVTSSEFYTIYKEAEHENAYDGISLVEKNTRFTYYMQTDKDKNGSYYTITPYLAMIDAAGNKTFQQSTAITSRGDGKYSGEIAVDKDTQVWFDITGTDGTHYFAMDLTNGNIRVTEDPNGGVIIEQNGYRLSGYRGDIYLTTSGYPTSNTLTIDCNTREIGVYMDEINAANNGSVIHVDSGTMNMTFSNADNLIQSLNGTPVTVGENGILHIKMKHPNSLKLDAADNYSAITGEGTLILEDENGFLKLNELIDENDASQICIGTYQYIGSNPDYEAELNNGIYSFKMIGYLDSAGALHKKDDLGEDNTANFAARGVFPVLTGMTEGEYRINNYGNLEMDITLDAGYAAIGYSAVTKANGDVLQEGLDYKVTEKQDSDGKKYYTFEIFGSSFKEGNVIVYAAALGLIPYQGIDYDEIYDGEAHTITVAALQDFKVYYSESPLNDDNYTSGADTPPEYTDVLTDKKVYWYICSEKEPDKYQPVAGHNLVTIREAQNEWKIPLTCPDVVSGNKARPSVEAKWGEEQYIYYKDKDGTQEVTASDYVNGDIDAGILKVGTYYVKAWVPEDMGIYGNRNYAKIETDVPIRFRVFETEIYTENTRAFEKLRELKTINIFQNGAFTIYYKTTGDEGMALKFSENLPKDTKLTFIVFKEEEQSPEFYYYNLSGAMNEVPLTNFVKMGMMSEDTDSHYVQQVGEQVEYQFCVEAADNTSPLPNTDVSLVGMENSTVRVTTAAVDAYFTKDFVKSSEDGEDYVDITLASPGGQGMNKIVAFTINKVSDEPRPFVVKLMNGAETIEANAASNGNLFVFNLGNGPIQETTYRLVLKDLTPNETYSITGDVRAVPQDVEHMYALANVENGRNRKTTSVMPTAYTETILHAEIEKQEGKPYRIYPTDTANLTFKMSSNKVLDGLAVDIYYKDNGRYVLEKEGLQVSCIDDNATVTTSSVGFKEGIYRFVFKLGDATCNYNVIISNL